MKLFDAGYWYVDWLGGTGVQFSEATVMMVGGGFHGQSKERLTTERIIGRACIHCFNKAGRQDSDRRTF